MKRSVILSIALGGLILIMSLGTNAYQHSQVKQALVALCTSVYLKICLFDA